MLHVVSCSQPKETGLREFKFPLNFFAFIMIKANLLCIMVFAAAKYEIKLKKIVTINENLLKSMKVDKNRYSQLS